MRSSWVAFVFLPAIAQAASVPSPVQVNVSFIEALAPRDTTSSERFQKDYDKAIEVGKKAVASRLQKCGYELKSETAFYDASDPLQARERAADVVKNGTWLIVGPRRSNHYILLAQGAGEVPTVSLMASASEVAKLGSRHVSLSPLNTEMAEVAAQEAKRRIGTKSATYVSIVNSDCVTCVDFATAFDAKAEQIGLRKAASYSITGDSPALKDEVEAIRKFKPDFILIPNYSKSASLLMAQLAPSNPKAFFVGGDGWGDFSFGFVHDSEATRNARGFTVRGYPPFDQGLAKLSNWKQISEQGIELPHSGPSLGILKSMDALADLLCNKRPKSRDDFARAFEQSSAARFQSPWGISVYDLHNGEITFSKMIGGRSK